MDLHIKNLLQINHVLSRIKRLNHCIIIIATQHTSCMQNDVNKLSYGYRVLLKGMERDGNHSKRVLTAFLLQVREISCKQLF